MLNNNENQRASDATSELAKLKEEIISIIEENRYTGIKSEIIADEIVGNSLDNEIVVEDNRRTERPVNIEDIVFIAKRAIQQAEFDGAFVVLPSGERIKRREKYVPHNGSSQRLEPTSFKAPPAYRLVKVSDLNSSDV